MSTLSEESGAASRTAMAEWGLYLFAVGMWSNRALAVVGTMLLLAGLLREPERYRVHGDRLLLWCLGLWLAGLLISYLGVLISDVGSLSKHAEAASRFALLALFVPVGRVIGADAGRALLVLLLAMTGFVCARLESPELAVLNQAQWWTLPDRIGLGLAPLALGAIAAFLLSTLLVFLPRLWSSFPSRWERAALVVIAMVFAYLLAMFLLASLARSAWLAFATALLVLTGVHLVQAVRGRRLAWIPLLLMLLTLLVVSADSEVIGSRLASERSQFEQLLNGDVGELSAGHGDGHKHSVGARYVMIGEALSLWSAKPWFGHGPAAPELFVRSSENAFLRYYSDYHNAVLNILVSYGALGLLLFVVPPVVVLVHVWRATKADPGCSDIRLFIGLSVWMLLLSAVLNYRLLNYDWRFWYWLVLGTAYGFAYRRQPSVAID